MRSTAPQIMDSGAIVEATPAPPEVDFPTMDIAAIAALFIDNGYVLLRRFWDMARLAEMKATVQRLHREVNAYHLYPNHYYERGLELPHLALLAGKSRELLDAIYDGVRYWPLEESCLSRHVTTERGEGPGWMPPFRPHIDACVIEPEFAINFWTPLQPCGIDLPSLGIIRAGFDEVAAFVGHDPNRVWYPQNPWEKFGFFQPKMMAIAEGEAAETEAFWALFAGRVWTPSYEVGDAMMLSNWTLHFTHAADMRGRRENLELRLMSEAPLPHMLARFRERRAAL